MRHNLAQAVIGEQMGARRPAFSRESSEPWRRRSPRTPGPSRRRWRIGFISRIRRPEKRYPSTRKMPAIARIKAGEPTRTYYRRPLGAFERTVSPSHQNPRLRDRGRRSGAASCGVRAGPGSR